MTPATFYRPSVRSHFFPLLVGVALLCGAAPTLAQAGAPADTAPAAPGVLVDTVIVRGNHRVASDLIRLNSALQPGQRVVARDVQSAIHRLMATGDFSDVRIYVEGDPAAGARLIVQVAERPLIARIDFKGLQHVNAKTIRDTLKLKDNVPLDPNLVARTEKTIADLVAKAGIQLLSVDTTLTPVIQPAGAFRLTFNVKEGNRLSVAGIEFVGNEAFSDGDLVGALKTKPEGFLWFRSGKYDRAKWEEDLQKRLPEFYGQHGYIDFAIVSDTMIVDPHSGNAILRVKVDEGPQYRLGTFTVAGASHFPQEQLKRLFTSEKHSVLGLPFGSDSREQGEVFDQAALDAATQKAQQMYSNDGYLFAQVIPRIERVPAAKPGESPTVNVTWAVSEDQPFYINRVVIDGNTYTHESVIRDRLLVFPGDVYNEDRLIQSYKAISGLGFFQTPLPQPDINPNPDSGTVDITFHVKEKPTGSIGFGTSFGGASAYSSGGLSGFLSYSQPNLFGEGKQADVRVEYGFSRNSFTAGYTDPALFGTRNSASVQAFHTDDSFRGVSFSEGRYVRTGASLQYGFPLFGLRWTRAFVGYSLSHIHYEARSADECSAGDLFCLPDQTASDLSLAVTRDTRNHPLFPTAGGRQNLTLEQTGGPLGGNGNFQKLTAETQWWVPVGKIGGKAPGSTPIFTTFGLTARTGAVFGDASGLPLSRFWLGGTQYGEQLRGYGETEITPFGYFPQNSSAIGSLQRLGNAFLTVSGEYAVRLNDNISVSAFAEAGNIWQSVGLIDPTRLYRSAGLGATVVTPFGPIGVDIAYGFDKTQPGWKFHFKINSSGF
ncbi:MAG TPA: outer membrane protein assembly factor BamA [Longimicrobiaceae bacterium]|nr:outer membrane protein assembly factor BamA [Longimicrobiaceae bacterium]